MFNQASMPSPSLVCPINLPSHKCSVPIHLSVCSSLCPEYLPFLPITPGEFDSSIWPQSKGLPYCETFLNASKINQPLLQVSTARAGYSSFHALTLESSRVSPLKNLQGSPTLEVFPGWCGRHQGSGVYLNE